MDRGGQLKRSHRAGLPLVTPTWNIAKGTKKNENTRGIPKRKGRGHASHVTSAEKEEKVLPGSHRQKGTRIPEEEGQNGHGRRKETANNNRDPREIPANNSPDRRK